MPLAPRLLASILCLTVVASAQDSLSIFEETLFSPPFPTLERGRPANGPWNNDVIVYRAAPDGVVTRAATFERAGVPTIARLRDGRLLAAHQHFPENDPASFDKVAVHFSSDDGHTWTEPAVVQLTGLPVGMRFPFDPTLAPLPDGRVRLYFTSLLGRRFEEARPAIHSAISDDGINYTYEPGIRFAIENRPVIDCAVVLHQGTFHLFSPDNGTQIQPGPPPQDDPRAGIGYHAISTDGLTFARVEDVRLEGQRRRWLGNAQSNGDVITFYGTGMPFRSSNDASPGNLWIATSADGKSWQPAASPPVYGADPGAVTTPDGTVIFVVTGEPRQRSRG